MRVALHSRLHEGMEAAYEQAHRVVPDDVLAAMRRVGIWDWTIWRSGPDLFHLVECEDFDRAMRELADDPADQRWQARMGAFVARFVENPDGPAGRGLRDVWNMRRQLGEPPG